MSKIDHLTALLDRESLDAEVTRDVREARASGQPFSVIFVDIDHFKKVNDVHGHAAGDQVLKQVARRLRSVVEGKGRAYRYGGEELVVLLPNHSAEEAAAVAERARRELEAQAVQGISVTASFGIACCPDHSDDGCRLLEAADKAAYDAKRLGRNLVRILGEPEPSDGQDKRRPSGKKIARPTGMSPEAKQHYRRLHFQGHVIKCPKDLTPFHVSDITGIGSAGRDLLVSCPMCGFTEELTASDD